MYREVTLPNNNKTLSKLISLSQTALNGFSNQTISAIVREDGTRVESDLDVCFYLGDMALKLFFSGKFYWVVSDEQRSAWTNEFYTSVGPGQTRMSGDKARKNFTSMSRVSLQELAIIWYLSDVDKDHYLSLVEYILAKFLIYAREQGQTFPEPLPQTLIDTLAQSPQIKTPIPKTIKRKSTLSLLGNESIWMIQRKKYQAYSNLFTEHNDGGFVTGTTAKELFRKSGLDRMTLAKIWDLADIDKDSALNKIEFKIAMHLLSNIMKGNELPDVLPPDLASSAAHIKRIPSNDINMKNNQQNQSIISPILKITPVPVLTPYHIPNLLPPNQSINIGQWNFDAKQNKQTDVIQNIAAEIRNNLNNLPKTPSTTVHPSAHYIGDAEKQISGVIKIEPSMIHRETLLGGGTFGKVWRGSCSGEIVAIKDMSYNSIKEIEMWKREVQLLSILQNENFLVKLKGYCISPEHLTIIMEFMDGGSLYELIHKRQKLPWSMLQKARILRHIAKAIESVHRLKVIHRDIKSMNILLDRNGMAKLADLGCSRVVREETMTVGVGSPLWMAPEVSKSSNYSYPSDIFSYGVVIFEVFNEKLPEYDVSARRVSISSECIGYAIIKECTRTKPEQRPTASQIIDSLDLLMTTFTNTVSRVVLKNYTGDKSELPREDDVHGWYNILLSYDRETFDVLLSSGLNGQK